MQALSKALKEGDGTTLVLAGAAALGLGYAIYKLWGTKAGKLIGWSTGIGGAVFAAHVLAKNAGYRMWGATQLEEYFSGSREVVENSALSSISKALEPVQAKVLSQENKA
jgi:hypothetical protein